MHGRRIPIYATAETVKEREQQQERAFATVCPICNRRYGIHDVEEMIVCFPALVEVVNSAILYRNMQGTQSTTGFMAAHDDLMAAVNAVSNPTEER